MLHRYEAGYPIHALRTRTCLAEQIPPDGVRLGKPTSERGREGLVKRENGRNLINGQLTMDNWFAVVLLKLSIVNCQLLIVN